MKIIRIIQKPIIKAFGILVILYFALFNNKENPESLGNRLSTESIKKNFGEAFQKSQSVITNVKFAGEKVKDQEKEREDKFQKYEVGYLKVSKGEGEEIVDCSDYVSLSYKIIDDEDRLLAERQENLSVGSGKNLLLERNIFGMKVGEIRSLIIHQDYDGPDNLVKEIVERYKRDIKYEITIINFNKDDAPQPYCKSD